MDKAFLLWPSHGDSVEKTLVPREPDGLLGRLIHGRETDDDLTYLSHCHLKIGPPESEPIPDVIGWSIGPYFLSPEVRRLVEELEPGVHRYFEIAIRSDVEIGGKTEHGVYYLLRKPPSIDCLAFPDTATRSDFHGVAWSKETSNYSWGGGLLSAGPTVLDGRQIHGHHLWTTWIANDGHQTKLTCSMAFWNRFRSSGFRGWEPEQECKIK